MMNALTEPFAGRTEPIAEALLRRLRCVKIAARVSLGLVWLWEGLVPKIIWVTPIEVDMVRRSGLFWPSPAAFLVGLGLLQVAGGLVLIAGWKERLAVAVATIGMLILIVLVVGNAPVAVVDPFGGLAKDFCLIACALTVWILAPFSAERRFE